MPRPWITLALCLSLGVCLAPPAAVAAALGGLALLLARRPGLALPIAAVAAGAWAGGATARWADARPPRPPAPLTGTVTDVRLVGVEAGGSPSGCRTAGTFRRSTAA